MFFHWRSVNPPIIDTWKKKRGVTSKTVFVLPMPKIPPGRAVRVLGW